MKLLSRVSILGATVAAASVVSTGSVLAMTVEQTQELTASTSAKVTGSATSITSEATSSSFGKQTQRVDVPEVAQVARYRYRAGRTTWIPATSVIMMNDGQVRLSWPMRGGTCHIRYTEASQATWKYATAASCDDGGVTIGGLEPGVKYKFQVRQDNGAWSRIMTGRAH